VLWRPYRGAISFPQAPVQHFPEKFVMILLRRKINGLIVQYQYFTGEYE
jgi:hypothetical protein